MTCIIELTNATKLYGNKIALRDVSLSIGPGITGLLGPNGSGKSTLIKALMGLVTLSSGSANVLGKAVPAKRRLVQDQVGYLPEDDCFIAGLSGIEAVHLMAQLAGLPRSEGLRRSHEMLDYADVGQERYRPIETYSTGMRQKLKFAQALVHDPKLIIMDEPTNGLDPQQRASMLRRLVQLAEKHSKSILLSTHILHDVQETCQSVVILAQGNVRLHDSLARLSQPTRPGMQVNLREDPAAFIELLARQSHVVEKQNDGSLWIHDIRPDDCGCIWRAAQETSVSIVNLQPAKNSLEQIFIDAVRETSHVHS